MPKLSTDLNKPSDLNRLSRNSMNISVIICTYNRASKLLTVFKSLMDMHVPEDISWELLCVDNNSSDCTKQTIQEFARQSNFPVRHIFEKNQGLANARNAGIRSAQGQIITFTDDDCIVDRKWIEVICKEFKNDSKLDFVGGRVELRNMNDLPISIRTSRERANFTPTALFSLIPGCNMAFRRQVAIKGGLFDPVFGAGARIPSAEDSDFIYNAYNAGFKIVYSPDLLVYHDHGRRTKSDLNNITKQYIIGRGGFYMKHILRGDRLVIRMAYWEFVDIIEGIFRNIVSFRWRMGGKEVGHLGRLMEGAFSYLWTRIF